MEFEVRQEEGFRFYEAGQGEPLILLHGLFGALSNFKGVIEHFAPYFNVWVPVLPLYELPLEHTNLEGLAHYLKQFIEFKKLAPQHLIGNSLGGHVALMHTIDHPHQVKSLVLTGSSGLFESALGESYPKKGDYQYVKTKTEFTFYDPAVASKDLVDEVYAIVNNRDSALRILYLARSAMKTNLKEHLHTIQQPTLLIWGKEDYITPQFVGEMFHELLPDSELEIFEKCGHAAMMEHPGRFNVITEAFYRKRGIITA